MASFNCFALAFLIALSFAGIDVGVAARHLLQQPRTQSLPSFPNLPTPSRPSFSWPGALPPLPTTFPTGLPLCQAFPQSPQSQLQFPLFLSLFRHCHLSLISQTLGRFLHFLPHCQEDCRLCQAFPPSQLQFPLFLPFLHHLLVLFLEIPPFLVCCILDLV
ncbi:hypothetical protein ERO13_D13G051832v2 [Gossypium hirsutum]|nr:hypothetical protein ERO13_D13G051832v2 [Gossypium hirsutum]